MVMLVSRIYRTTISYTLVAVPLFIFMASILERCGIADELFHAVHIWAGGLRGGLAIGTIISCVIMAAITGVVGAEIVTFGLIALPGMLKRKYDKKIALGSICAGGGMATLIPPSVVFIVYALEAGASVGDLFLAGIIPGLILAALFIAYIVFVTWRKPELAPAAPLEERQVSLRQKLLLLKGLIMPGILAIVVLGSIYAGLATPTEAAGMGVAGALLTGMMKRRLSWVNVKVSLYETTKVTCLIMWLVFGAQTIIGVYTLAGGDDFVRSAMTKAPFGNWGVIIYMQLIFILLGMFIDWIGILMLTMPLFLPIVLEMGFSNVWFGVVFCMNMHISYLTPPFGPSVIYLKGIVPDDITTGDIYNAVWPYTALTVVALTLTVMFPGLSLWLPSMMM
jgi:tripartite ATP-independent transporter DctM subunit